jgi:hypothetical protein
VTLAIDLSDEHGKPAGDPVAECWAQFRPVTGAGEMIADGFGAPATPVRVRLFGAGPEAVSLIATDDPAITPKGWCWEVSFPGVPHAPEPFTFELRAANGLRQSLAAASGRLAA